MAEDEPLLADELCEQLGALWPQLHIAARVGDGVAALQAIETHAPDIALLDIRMPRLTGLEVAQNIAGRCHAVFISAYDQHALAAFEAGGIDYVLKPLSTPRLATMVRRLKARLGEAAPDCQLAWQQLAATGALMPRQHLQWINASRGSAVQLLTVDEILCFRADSRYTLVLTADAESVIRKPIKELAEELDPTMFWQVHRSCIVNVHAIARVVRDDRGGMLLRLKEHRESLPVAAPYHYLFRSM
ncbi:MAG: LytTR family DNA-binding domain-containing protein [Ideonella sp.]